MIEGVNGIMAMVRQKEYLEKILNRTFTPLLVNLFYVSVLWDMLREYDGMSRKDKRRLFLFAVLFFYAPRKLFSGGRVDCNLSVEVCRVTGCDKNRISHDCADLVASFLFRKKMRLLTETYIKDICGQLYENGVPERDIKEYLRRYEIKN